MRQGRSRRTRKGVRQGRTHGGQTHHAIFQQREYGRNIAHNAAQLAEKVMLSWKRQRGLA